MSQELLNDAAIVLHRILINENVKYGIFGGYAISAFGGHRVTKDIDVLASATKDEITKLLGEDDGFEALAQSRDDYVAFLWAEKAAPKFQVLIEVFCEKFTGSEHTMDDVSFTTIPIKGLYHGPGIASFLDPIYLFKGKLHAAATRRKAHDAADMRALVSRYEEDIADYVDDLNIKYIGLAIKRHAELAFLFRGLDVDIDEAEQAIKNVNLNDIQQPIAVGSVQSGILASTIKYTTSAAVEKE
ncbi:uncharacterized protein GGS22DRAFT_192764 [Annulohypoxylon maeteangense]|uniref:uncharacterized protein n=1 Tax=Annulohypoxylon maeteangense TaxID=1927788 RepID=UPI0020071ECF|nr:uncharacterized protein GGS22DRAFT_192764 [Annulohypoxylon maeteangense]KAI0880927.1 hypothetical protein GGS22DRAFT_192764 [Annulohypoxylon maeteangense]